MPRAEDEGRRVALVGGEPGSGKSRLVREFAHEAAAYDALVLYGACDAVLRTPYQPFVESLDQLVRGADPATLRADLGTTGGELTRLLPDLPLRVGDVVPPVAADPDTERYRLHTVVTDLLTSAGGRRPLLFVLEDVHWADAPTLLLLRHLAQSAVDTRILLLATYRDTESEMTPELSDALADLRRGEGVARLRLEGLSSEQIAEFIRGTAGGDTGSDLSEIARAIGDLTEGNPFLLSELWRTLVETGGVAIEDGDVRLTRPLADLGSPEGVGEVVSQRLSRLAPSTVELLELAAVAGSEFELATVKQASALADTHLIAAVEEAERSGMIEAAQGHGLGYRYRFTHELVRRALYERLTGLRRAELHLRVGDALEHAGGPPAGRILVDLAHHFAAAAPIEGTGRGVEYNVLAAHAAMTALAFDEAAARLGMALQLGIEGARERAEVQLELGTACHRGGRAADALAAFTAAAASARELGDAETLAWSAIGFEEACWRPGIADKGALELLEEAAAALGEGESALRVRLFAALSRALVFRGDPERGTVVRENAASMARRLGDRPGLAAVLERAYWARGASTLEEVLDMLAEARELGEELKDIEIRAEAICWRVPAFVGLCDLDSARREVAALLETATEMGQPFFLHAADQFAATLSLCTGDFEEAGALAERSRDWGRLLAGRDASGGYGLQMFSLRREQGRLAELAPMIRLLCGGDRRSGAWRPGLVALLVELGMEDEARRELAALQRDGLDSFRASLWLAALTYLTDVSAALDDAELAALLYPELEPLAGGNVMIGHAVACYGAADRYIGMLATTLRDWGTAERCFEQALELNRRMGAITWLAHTAYEYGRMLLARHAGDDRSRAASLLGEGAALAERIGMPALLARIRALGSPVRPSTALPDGLSAREVQILRLAARGMSNREIGRTVFISEHTAASHVRSILRKTGCANRTEAASYAHRQGLVDA
jgi:DNA-binding CsgD family transcriptional regulator/tetratricopeptide (TPR) repeat protein